MGFNYSAHIAVGYRFVKSEYYIFETHTTEFYHMERNYDQKTGKELAEVKVIDKESLTVYHINNKDFYSYLEFIDELCLFLGCKYYIIGELNNLESSLILSPNYNFDSFLPGEDFGKVEFGNSFKFSDIVNLEPELLLLKNKLQSLGLRVPEPGIFLAYSYS